MSAGGQGNWIRFVRAPLALVKNLARQITQNGNQDAASLLPDLF